MSGGKGKLTQADRERSLQALMTTNLLKRLESSIESFKLTLKKLHDNYQSVLSKIKTFKRHGQDTRFTDITNAFEQSEQDEDNIPDPDDHKIGSKVQISLADMDVLSWEQDLKGDLIIIDKLLTRV